MKLWPYLLGMAFGQECEPINVDFCVSVQGSSNYSVFKNNPGRSQREVANLLSSPGSAISTLRETGCHKNLVPFICMYYLPVCPDDYGKPVYPCREVCESVKSNCGRIQTGVDWPGELDCTKLPKVNEGAVCASHTQLGGGTQHPSGPKCPAELYCPRVLETGYGSSHYFLDLDNCAPPCHDHFWSDEEIDLSRKWILTWSILCLVSTLFTVSTYLIDRERFRYPERPIVFLAACYMIISAVYITGFAMDNKISCSPNPLQQDPKHSSFSVTPTMLVEQGTRKQSCTVLFMILYFSTMSSAIWWLVLCITWFMAAVLKWSGEAIELQSQYFHLISWSIPAIMTISVLALGKIEGDPLSGVCFVGQYDTISLQTFLLWPQLILICIGFVFLILGFLSMYRIRLVVKNEHPGKHEGLEKLMLKIGVFSSLYLIPASVLLGCYFYIYMYDSQWNNSWLMTDKAGPSGLGFRPTCDIQQQYKQDGQRLPNFTFFMLRYFMSLIVGVTCGFWIWSDKTINSWSKFLRSVTCRKRHNSGVIERREVTRSSTYQPQNQHQMYTTQPDSDPLLSRNDNGLRVTTTSGYHSQYTQASRPL